MREPGFVSRAVSVGGPFESQGRFVVTAPAYAPQYAQLYFCRLVALRESVSKAARASWGDARPGLAYAERVLGAAGRDGKVGGESVAVGLVFRDLPGKPSILREYKREGGGLIPAPPRRERSYAEGGDARVVLEDETGRFAIDVSDVPEFGNIATGFVVAVRGREVKETGAFRVSHVVCAGLAPQVPLASLPLLPGDRFVCVVSGLGFGGVRSQSLPAELLLEYLRGNVGGGDAEDSCGEIVQLIVAGGCIAPAEREERPSRDAMTTSVFEKAGKEVGGTSAIVLVDRFLTAAAATLPTAVMPGEDDPVNYMLPQQPLHRSLLPSASREANLQRVTNPSEAHFDGRVFLGSAGQNVHDFAYYNADTSPGGKFAKQSALPTMEVMMSNRHMAPTAPDTLGVYPFTENDPFVIDSTPHVFYAGNQSAFESKLLQRAEEGGKDLSTRLVCVPRFDQTGVAVLVNLRTLGCTTISFCQDVMMEK